MNFLQCILQIIFQLDYDSYLSLFDGDDQKVQELQRLYGEKSSDYEWVISSSGHHMFVKFDVGYSSSSGFLAKIHFGT